MKRLKVSVETLSPIVLTAESHSAVMTGTRDAISGSILRGVMAAKYIEGRGLAKAHEDEEFRRLFFGALRFTDANIASPEDGARSFAIPLSMQKEKAKEGETEAVEDLTRAEDPTKGMKSFRGYAVLTDGNLIKTVSAAKDISLHMSRMGDEERKKGRSEDGGIYNYESISPGQTFVGFLIGEDSDIAALRARLPQDSFACRVGRSKFTQYGQCRVKLGETAEALDEITADHLEAGGRKLILRLDSPLLFDEMQIGADGTPLMATATNVLGSVARAMNQRTGGGFSVQNVFAAETEIENYVGVWGMKRPRERALAAGSVFALVKDTAWTEADFTALNAVAYGGVGRRTEEGFGQLRHWPNPAGKWEKPKASGENVAAPLPMEEVSETTAEIAKSAFVRRLAEQMRVYAAEDAKNALHIQKADGLSGLTHFFSRLSRHLDAAREDGKPEGIRARLCETLKNEIPSKSSAENNLKNTLVGGRPLYDMLRDAAELPYAGRPWLRDVGTKEEQTIAFLRAVGLAKTDFDLTDGECFYEYWHWFFRQARKRAVTVGKEAEADG